MLEILEIPPFVCVGVYVCVWVGVSVPVCVWVSVYVSVCVCVCVCVYVCVRMSVCVSVCMCLWVSVRVCGPSFGSKHIFVRDWIRYEGGPFHQLQSDSISKPVDQTYLRKGAKGHLAYAAEEDLGHLLDPRR